MKPAPIKSAFGPIKPKIDLALAQKLGTSSPPVKQAPPKAEKKQSQTQPTPQPLPESVELWFELTNRGDREVFGWISAGNRTPKSKGILTILNRAHWLVKQSLELGDARMLTLLIALTLGEGLLIRQKHQRWIAATLEKLRESLLPEEKRSVAGLQFLAQALASSDSLSNLGTELVASGGTETGWKQFDVVNLEEPEPQ
jgi:hypothetical protein